MFVGKNIDQRFNIVPIKQNPIKKESKKEYLLILLLKNDIKYTPYV